jgi:hypothetical protein
MFRSLTPAEMNDRNLLVYLDLNNIQDGYVIKNLATQNSRIQGYMGGALGIEVNRPIVVPVAAPIVSSFASASTVKVTMKESGDYQSTIAIPVNAIDDALGTLIAGPNVTYSITQFPSSAVLILSKGAYGVNSLNPSSLSASTIGTTFSLFATHIRNDAVDSWGVQAFTIRATAGPTIINIPVQITIMKNAAPIIGDTGGAIVPPDQPTEVNYMPLKTQKPVPWKNSTYNVPITMEFWFVTTMDNRYLSMDSIQLPTAGRINAEVNKNLNFDYGWQFDGAGRTFVPIRHKYGLWSHAAVVSSGLGGSQKLYLNGELVAQGAGSSPVRGQPGDPVSDAKGNFYGNFISNLAIDELRIWTTNRSIEDIRSNMFKTLTGKETNLYMYHNFDSYTVRSDGSYLFKDLGPNGYDFICMGYNKPNDCPFTRSLVPIGGITEDVSFVDGAAFAYWTPSGFDPDDDSKNIRFVFDVLPRYAQLRSDRNVTFRFLDGDFRYGRSTAEYITNITVGSYIRKQQGIPSIQIAPSSMGGGNPYDSFTYHITDGLRNSKQATITIYRKCPPGTFLDQANRKCIACAPGFYSTDHSYNDRCLPCPIGTSQSKAGSSSCAPCSQAVFISLAKAVNTSTGATVNTTTAYPEFLSTVTVGVNDIASFGTFQELSGQSTCKACPNLSYAIKQRATSCDGQAFIPRYIALNGIEELFRSSTPTIGTNGTLMTLTTASNNSSSSLVTVSRLTSILDSSIIPDDVVSAFQNAGVVASPKVVLAVSLIIAIITLIGLIGIYFLANDPVIKASSPVCLTFTAMGIMLGVLSTVTYSVKPTNGSCIAEIWVFPIAWSIVFGTLISKTFRILRIFNK